MRELASAILLVIELVFFQQLVPTFLQAVFAPVLRPESDRLVYCAIRRIAVCRFCGTQTRRVDLVQVLPSRRSKGGGEKRNIQFLRLTGGMEKPVVETRLAPSAPFGLMLQPFYGAKPLFMTPVIVYPLDSQTLCVPFALVLADLILLERVYVRIIIIDHWLDPMRQQPFYNSAGTGGATRVQQHFRAPLRNDNCWLFGHIGCKITKKF